MVMVRCDAQMALEMGITGDYDMEDGRASGDCKAGVRARCAIVSRQGRLPLDKGRSCKQRGLRKRPGVRYIRAPALSQADPHHGLNSNLFLSQLAAGAEGSFWYCDGFPDTFQSGERTHKYHLPARLTRHSSYLLIIPSQHSTTLNDYSIHNILTHYNINRPPSPAQLSRLVP